MGSSGFSFKEVAVFPVGAEALFNAIATGKPFGLTGAKDITLEFVAAGSFKLGFGERGTISGRFEHIIRPDLVSLSWNVSGFDRPDEHSKVFFRIVPCSAKESELQIHHELILSEKSLGAKKRAWKEILADLGPAIQNG